ncbi:ParB/Srx family N-terminal domain-containing protein (plasmid) [Vibrio coralliilyticus]|uniref:ParB/Srx family N-terminal domain-containing protein n=1 Tax=Vibrio coralliilyticus TaxID=190893 RepID=UPI00068E14C2|nr:ParB/Srx family N-terminal domain-containing protein [Vibrio coralliilyticus]
MPLIIIWFFFAALLAGCQPHRTTPPTPPLNSTDVAPIATLGPKGHVEYLGYTADEVHQVPLGDLMPTQKTLGGLQNDYKLGRWSVTPIKAFEALCESAGLRDKLAQYDERSRLSAPESFTCDAPRDKDGMVTLDQEGVPRLMDAINTVIVGPDGTLYLTDGHHTFSRFHDIAQRGINIPVVVRVEANWAFDKAHQRSNMADFWRRMEDAHRAYLFDRGQAILPSALPSDLGARSANNPTGLSNDDYRALVYFTRGIGWDKGAALAIPFLEYYWAEELRGTLQVTGQESLDEYVQLVLDASKLMVSLPDDYPLGSSGKTAAELGQLDVMAATQQDLIETLVCEWDADKARTGKLKLGKLGWAFYHRGTAIEDFPEPCNALSAYKQRYDLSH